MSVARTNTTSRLGQRRAASAKSYLTQHGIAASRIETISYGEERPVAQGSDESGMVAESTRGVRDHRGRAGAPPAMRRWASVAPLALLLAATGCLASKSDIQLLQDEFRATRAQAAAGDTTILRADDARRAQIAQLSASIARMNDSLRVLSSRLAGFPGDGERRDGRDGAPARAVPGAARPEHAERTGGARTSGRAARAGKLRRRPASSASPPPSGTDSVAAHRVPRRARARDPVHDRGRTAQEREAIERRAMASISCCRRIPSTMQASLAQLHVGEAYVADWGTLRQRTRYTSSSRRKYPKSQEAPIAMYRHGRTLWDANNKVEARRVLNRVIQDYPGSDAAKLARDLLAGR